MKSITLKLIALTVVNYFADYHSIFLSIFALIIIDWFTGAYAAVKNGEKVRSKKVRPTVEKSALYSVALVAVTIIQKTFLPVDSINLVLLIGSFMAFRELLSILENVSNITNLPLLRYFKTIVDKNKEVFDDMQLDKSTKDKKDETTP
ncbi:MAG: hypothetical protein EOO06_00400 [Chitinophagaceae bacterium]|nr:MAG: hypothetical protein EOO06_00400 [Chitinophagaceae bacterium]